MGLQNPALAWLACLLFLALAWSGLGLSCLPCLGLVQQQQQRRRSRRRPPKAAGCCRWTRPRQGRHDRTRVALTRPRPGTTGPYDIFQVTPFRVTLFYVCPILGERSTPPGLDTAPREYGVSFCFLRKPSVSSGEGLDERPTKTNARHHAFTGWLRLPG